MPRLKMSAVRLLLPMGIVVICLLTLFVIDVSHRELDKQTSATLDKDSAVEEPLGIVHRLTAGESSGYFSAGAVQQSIYKNDADGCSAVIVPEEPSTLSCTNTQGLTTTIQVPVGAVTEMTTLNFSSLEGVSPPVGFFFSGVAFELSASQGSTLLLDFVFRAPITVTIHYGDEVEGLGEESLFLKREIPSNAGNWEEAACGSYNRNPQENWLAIPICYSGVFALVGEAHTANLPIVHHFRSRADCSESSFGTMLLMGEPDDWIKPIDVLTYANDQLGIKGLAGAGAPSELVRDEWFGRLTGWTRLFLRGVYSDLVNIDDAAAVFDMEAMYECIGYGPESMHQAGDEALNPQYWVPQAEALAEAIGKCLIYGPAVQDYERMSTPEGKDRPQADLLADLVTQIAPHVDIWMIQLAKYQHWADNGHDDDGNPYTMDDFGEWISKWVAWIKTANPNAKVWTQLGIGRFDPLKKVCLPPQPPTYITMYREALAAVGVDGVWVMPALPCQSSDDPQDRAYYLESLAAFQEAIVMSCAQ